MSYTKNINMKKIWVGIFLVIVVVATIYFFYKHNSLQLVVSKTMKLSSSAFQNGNQIPPQYTCDGIDINPPLTIDGVPSGAKSLALIVDDPDAPSGNWVHWLLWNIPADAKNISEHFTPNGTVEGTTSFGKTGWGGPCPPSGVHRYVFRLFALNAQINLPSSANRTQLEDSMQGHVIDRTELLGTYIRENSH